MTVEVPRLYKMADLLVCTLKVESGGQVRGKRDFAIRLPGIPEALKINQEVISSFVDFTGEDLGLIVRVRGQMSIFAFHTESDRTVKMFILDRTKVPAESIPLTNIFERCNIKSYNAAIEKLKPCIVASFQNDEDGKGAWEPFKLP